jgi:hypothetical protein
MRIWTAKSLRPRGFVERIILVPVLAVILGGQALENPATIVID